MQIRILCKSKKVCLISLFKRKLFIPWGILIKLFYYTLLATLSLNTLLCRFRNCKLVVQSKLGLQRLAKLGYSNIHQWDVLYPLSFFLYNPFNALLFILFFQFKLYISEGNISITVLSITYKTSYNFSVRWRAQ